MGNCQRVETPCKFLVYIIFTESEKIVILMFFPRRETRPVGRPNTDHYTGSFLFFASVQSVRVFVLNSHLVLRRLAVKRMNLTTLFAKSEAGPVLGSGVIRMKAFSISLNTHVLEP